MCIVLIRTDIRGRASALLDRNACDERLSGLSFNVIMSALLQRLVAHVRLKWPGCGCFVAVGACGRHSGFNDSIKEINSVYRLKNIRTFYILHKFN